MSITTERMDKLTVFLNADEERAKKVLSLEPSVAVKEINAHDYDFSVEELQAYGEALNNTTKKLEDDALEGVAGGMDNFMSTDSVNAGNSNRGFVIRYAVMPHPSLLLQSRTQNLWNK